MDKQHSISDAEWQVMKTIWSLNQPTSKEIIDVLSEQEAWSVSTIKTLIGRLVKKDFLQHDTTQKPYTYYTELDESTAMKQRASSLFSQLCDMKKGEVLNELVDETAMSVDDLTKLRQIIENKLSNAPVSVECNCLEVS